MLLLQDSQYYLKTYSKICSLQTLNSKYAQLNNSSHDYHGINSMWLLIDSPLRRWFPWEFFRQSARRQSSKYCRTIWGYRARDRNQKYLRTNSKKCSIDSPVVWESWNSRSYSRTLSSRMALKALSSSSRTSNRRLKTSVTCSCLSSARSLCWSKKRRTLQLNNPLLLID